MWIGSKYGWFSIVNKDAGFHIRARVVPDLMQLQAAVGGRFAQLPIHETPEADYCARIFIPEKDKALLLCAMAMLADTVDYGNFKGMIENSPAQHPKLHAYHEVWRSMWRVQVEDHVNSIRGGGRKEKGSKK